MKKLIMKIKEIYTTFKYINELGHMMFVMNGQIADLNESNNNGYIENLESQYNNLSKNLDNRRQEISLVIEQLQNLDNHDVIRDLHLRILELEKRGEK